MNHEKKAFIAAYETELLVLGRSLNDKKAHKYIISNLLEEDFFDSDMRLLFNILNRLYHQDKPAGILFVLEALKNITEQHQLTAVFLTNLAHNATIDIDLKHYIDLLKQKTAARQFYFLMKHQFNQFNITSENPLNEIKNFHEQLSAIMEPLKKSSDFSPLFFKEKNDFVKEIEIRWNYHNDHQKDYVSGITTGLLCLDKQSIILEPGNLIVVAARPSVGKTAFALNIAHHISVSLDKPVGFFSLEMSHQQITERILSYCCEVSVEELRRGNFSKEKLLLIKEVEELFLKKHFFVCDKNISTIDQIINKAEDLAKRVHLGILFIDYLQLITAENKKENRQNEVANVSMKLKSLAKNLNIPVVCLSQLSRKVEDRSDKRPLMSDLRDSGQIEQDADAILLLYNKDHHHASNNDVNVMDVFLCKNRHGPTLSFRLNFKKSFGFFSLFDHNW